GCPFFMTLLDTFDRSFATISARSRAILDLTSDEILYKHPRDLPNTFAIFTVGEYVLRSAAAVEQTFGGITTRLWDDPFEWTLPEKLYSIDLVKEYLDEVDSTRAEGVAFVANDESLSKSIPAPVKIVPISQVLIDTLARSEHYLGRAYAVFQMISDEKLPRIESF
ncbi:MAG: hypothetical protein ABL984_12645, partial [Pyrinomonadaceae bacterium]